MAHLSIAGKLGPGKGSVKVERKHFVEGSDIKQMGLYPLMMHGITSPSYDIYLAYGNDQEILELSWNQKPRE